MLRVCPSDSYEPFLELTKELNRSREPPSRMLQFFSVSLWHRAMSVLRREATVHNCAYKIVPEHKWDSNQVRDITGKTR